MKRLLTVIMPVFNSWPYLPYAVESVLKQSIGDLQLIIVDDGSTDEGVDYLHRLSDPRVKVITQPNQGVVVSYNKALDLVETDFVARMDSDDICDVDKYKIQIEYLMAHPECVMVGTSAWHMSANGNQIGWPVQMPESHEEIISSLMKRRSAMICPTTLARTSVVRSVGGYQCWPAEDYEHFFAMGLRGKLANLPERMYTIRLHPKSVTARGMMTLQRKYEYIRQSYYPKYIHERPFRRKLQWINLISEFDIRAVYFYRRGITFILNEHQFIGYTYLLLACVLSPIRTFVYIKRRVWRVSK